MSALQTTCRLIALVATIAMPALQAAVIVQQTAAPTASTGTNLIPLGQSVTTPGGGPWDTIRFNFFDTNMAPVAHGTLFVLSQAYAGQPAGLSNATPGFLASSSTISGGVWELDTLTLQPNTQYFFYMGNAGLQFWVFSSLDIYGGGTMYSTTPGGYVSIPGQDMTFLLQGTSVGQTGAVPEPGTFALGGGAMLAILLRVRARRAGREN